MKKEDILKISIFIVICGVIALLYVPLYNSVLNLTGSKNDYFNSSTYKNKDKKDETVKENKDNTSNEETTDSKAEQNNQDAQKETKEDEDNNHVTIENINDHKEDEKEEEPKTYTLEKENNVTASEDCFEFDIKTGTIKDYKVSNDNSLKACPKNLIIPEKIRNVTVTKIGANAFKGKGLVSIELSKKITEIGEYAFYDNDLKQVVITYNVNKIGDSAFRKNNLKAVVSKVPRNRITIHKNAFLPFELSDIQWPETAEIPPSPIKEETE